MTDRKSSRRTIPQSTPIRNAKGCPMQKQSSRTPKTSDTPRVIGTSIPTDLAESGMARPVLAGGMIIEIQCGAMGQPVTKAQKVIRRPIAACLAKMPERLQYAAETYAQLYEAVQAGGGGSSEAPEKVDGGIMKREGRQSGMVDTVAKFNALRSALGPGCVRLDRRGTVVPIRHLVAAVAVKGAGLPSIFDALDVRRTVKRTAAMTEGIEAGLTRIADLLGY